MDAVTKERIATALPTMREACTECGGDGRHWKLVDVDVVEPAGTCERCGGTGFEPQAVSK